MNPWIEFLKEFRQKHPEMTYKQAMTKAAEEYKKIKK